jgi:hypothetical protein
LNPSPTREVSVLRNINPIQAFKELKYCTGRVAIMVGVLQELDTADVSSNCRIIECTEVNTNPSRSSFQSRQFAPPSSILIAIHGMMCLMVAAVSR